MVLQTTIVGGKAIKHKDAIHYNTVSQFPFWDRVRILFGKKVVIHSVIFTMNNQANVVETASVTIVEKLFNDHKQPKPVEMAAQPVKKMQAVK
jgi:hypothetical protein